MDWRRVLLWAGLAAILIASVVFIARVSIIAFGSAQKAGRASERPPAPAAKGAPTPADTPASPR